MLQLQFEPGSIPEASTSATRAGSGASVAGSPSGATGAERPLGTDVALSPDGLTPDAVASVGLATGCPAFPPSTTCRAASFVRWVALGEDGIVPAREEVRAAMPLQMARAATQASLEQWVGRFLGVSTMC